ncbi:MAG: hypothetical protein PHC51_02060 [bacterium]|nr:hypothetical protein [bacterium]
MFNELNNDDFIGHNEARKTITQQLISGRMAHALLFQGPKSIGKRRVAQFLAREVLSGGTNDNTASLLRAGNHPDLHVLQREAGKKNISIENVRELITRLQLKPFMGKKSVAIIDEAHEMSIPAANALLKTLEEPGSHCLIILISSAPHLLLETTISRCQKLNFGELEKREIEQIIANIARVLGLPDEQAQTLPALCPGDLSALGLGEFIDNKTLIFSSTKEASAHLKNISARFQTINSQLKSLVSCKSSTAEYLSTAMELSETKNDSDLTWSSIFHFLGHEMRKAPPAQRESWANLLLEALEDKQQASERNLSQPVLLANLFLRMAAI